MPELPEVETVRRVLEECLRGRVITSYAVRRPTFYRPPPASALKDLPGRAVRAVGRRGKYLLFELSGDRRLVMHLGMSGRIALDKTGSHTRFELAFGEQVVRFNDARRFGRVGCVLPKLGPEPLEPGFNEEYLWKALRGRRASIKAMLMDQAIVAGLGNIYATEALFKAGLRPGRAAGTLRKAQVAKLCSAVREVLDAAVGLRGSTLEDEAFLDPMGNPGRAQKNLSVYGRKTGACGHALKATRLRIGGRTSLYCPLCQK